MHKLRFTKKEGIGLAVGLIATFIPVLIFEITGWRLNGSFIYPVDDTFIHMQLAKNLALHGNWGINANEFSAASSSILYTLLLAFLSLLFSPGMFLPLLVNCIAAIILLYAVNQWLVKQQLSTSSHVLVMLAVVFFTPLPIMVISGMEHTLQCLFTFLFLFHGADWMAKNRSGNLTRWKLTWQLPVYALLLTATRYEGLFLVFILCLVLFFFRQFRTSVVIGCAALLPVVIFGLYSVSKGSFFLPNSVLIKSEEVSLFGGGVSHFFNTLLVDKFTLMKPGITLLATQRILLILALTYLAFSKKTGFRFSYALIIVLLFATTLLHLSLAATGKFYRYEAYLVFSCTLITATILCHQGKVWYHSLSHVSKVITVFLIVLISLPVLLRSTAAFSKAHRACINIYEQQYQMAGFVKQYYPQATIAANDIGAVSFFSNGYTVDLWGLGSIEIAKSRRKNYWTAGFMDSVAKKKNTTIVMIYDSWFHPSPGSMWTKIGSWQISQNVVCGDDLVTFYAVDSSQADDIRKNFRSYSTEKLPQTVAVKYY